MSQKLTSTPLVIDRISLRDLNEISAGVEADECSTAAKDEGISHSIVSKSADEPEKEPVVNDVVEKCYPVVHMSEPSPGKASMGLRRSLSDAADCSASFGGQTEVADEAEETTPSNEKHRFSLASAIKSSTSPILRRRQTVFDSAIQNLLQEGKEFLHRKRHQVPLFSALAKNESAPSTSVDANDPNHRDSQFGRTGSIMYRRKNDSVTLENSEDPADLKKDANLKAVKEEENVPAANIDNEQMLSSAVSSQEPAASSAPARPAALPQPVTAAPDDGAHGPGDNDPGLPNTTSLADDSQRKLPSASSGSLLWQYHKEVICAVLVALTAMECSWGWRALPMFILGLLWGVYLGYLIAVIVFRILLPPDRYPDIFTIAESSATDEDVVTFAPVEEVLAKDTVIYKGWVNRLPNKYDPRKYHINNTRSVLVRLDGNVLRLSTPKTNLSRHVYFRDPRMDPTFVSQEIFDITGANVLLRPKNLARRRWWSRKYPIAIILPQKDGDKEVRDQPMGKSQSSDLVEKAVSDEADGQPCSKTDAGELCQDALQQEDRQGTPAQGTDEEADDEEEDDDGARSLYSTSSVPSNLAGMSQTMPNQSARKSRRRRRIVNLFARSSREKEHWFYKLREAACRCSYMDQRKDNPHKRLTQSASDTESPPSLSRSMKQGKELRKKEDPLAAEWILYTSMQKQYERHMRSYMAQDPPKVDVQIMDLSSMMWKTLAGSAADASNQAKAETPSKPLPGVSIDWVNAFGSRLFYDFSRNPQWIGKVQDRIQRKLATVRLPYFIETLTLKKLAPGTTAPRVTAVSDPSMNEWGLWIDTKLDYLGGLRLVLETKLNLMKLKTEAGPRDAKSGPSSTNVSNYENEDIPESPESSPDEDAPSIVSHVSSFHHSPSKPSHETPRESTGKKILNFVDKIAQSKYFQEATENKYLKKLMQGVSDTPLVLEVEVVFVSGALAINIPPPPSDRLWYGFRCPPKVVLKARPKVGERVVNLSQITDWIENKFIVLLEKNLVIPNMDDLIVPIMSGSPLCLNYNR